MTSDKVTFDLLNETLMITWSYGGGRQSVAIAVLILQERLPRPDLIVMADTSREVNSTWEYLRNVVQPTFAKVGLRVQIAPHSYAKVDLFGPRGDVLMPCFTRQNGQLGRMPGFCSNEWKQRVIRRWLKDGGVTDTDVWLGISTDEVERMKPSRLAWYRHVYPLINIVHMSRLQCANEITRYGWPLPHRSRCWHCPNQTIAEWRELGEEEQVKAVNVDIDVRWHDPAAYLHLSGLPLAKALKMDSQQEALFDGCDSGYCMV